MWWAHGAEAKNRQSSVNKSTSRRVLYILARESLLALGTFVLVPVQKYDVRAKAERRTHEMNFFIISQTSCSRVVLYHQISSEEPRPLAPCSLQLLQPFFLATSGCQLIVDDGLRTESGNQFQQPLSFPNKKAHLSSRQHHSRRVKVIK